MAYDSIWVRLNDAIRLVVDATGCPKEEAQADILRALADGDSIQFRARLKQHANGTTSQDELPGTAFDRLTKIRPKHVDWEQSRPLNTWLVKYGAHRLHGWWYLEWIEVSRADIVRALCGVGQARGAATTARTNSRPKMQAVMRALQALYPGGPPDQVALSNTELAWRVRAKLGELGLPDAGPDTIFRAAGRRRK